MSYCRTSPVWCVILPPFTIIRRFEYLNMGYIHIEMSEQTTKMHPVLEKKLAHVIIVNEGGTS